MPRFRNIRQAIQKAHFYQTEVRHVLRKHWIIEVPIHYRAPSPRIAGSSISDSVCVLIHYTLLRLAVLAHRTKRKAPTPSSKNWPTSVNSIG